MSFPDAVPVTPSHGPPIAPAVAASAPIKIFHRTQYDFGETVVLEPHRLLLRPRESPSLRLASFDLTISPEAQLAWAEDSHGNAVATAVFSKPARRLVIEAVSRLDLARQAWPVFRIEPYAMAYPFRYDDRDHIDLGPLLVQQYPDPAGQVRNWARDFATGNPADTLSLLKALNAGVCTSIVYEARDSEGTQSPVLTLLRARGACRDLAVLFVEAARTLGFAARLVSGYLNDGGTDIGSGGPYGTTHAWAEIHVPGAGWIAFDPTNDRVGGYNLIPVAVDRDILPLAPVAGSFVGPNETKSVMSIEVRVTPAETPLRDPS